MNGQDLTSYIRVTSHDELRLAVGKFQAGNRLPVAGRKRVNLSAEFRAVFGLGYGTTDGSRSEEF